MKDDLLNALSSRARAHYRAALFSAFSASIIIIVIAKWFDGASSAALPLIAVCGLMTTLGSATQCIRLTLLEQKEKNSGSELEK